MKLGIRMFLLCLLTAPCCFGQTIQKQKYPQFTKDSLVIVTLDQIKKSNLIYVEHDKLSMENSELYAKIMNLNSLNKILAEQDSLRVQQVSAYRELNEKLIKSNEHLKSKSKNLIKWTIGGFSISAVLGVLLFLK